MKIRSILLLAGGLVQALIVALHVGLAVGLQRGAAPAGVAAEVWPTLKASQHIFNAAVATAVLGFACMSLFHRTELLTTRLGRTVCVFIALFYLQRAGVAGVLRGFEPGFGILLVGLAAVYVVAAVPRRHPLPTHSSVA